MSKYNFTKDKLEEFLNEVFHNRKPQTERPIAGWRGCATRGMVDIFSPHCKDENCQSCNSITKAIEDELIRANFKPYVHKTT